MSEARMADEIRSGEYVTFVPQGGVPVTIVRYGGIYVRVISYGGTPVTYVKYGGQPIGLDSEMNLPDDVKEELGY
jgi:hypothetical protein